MRSRDALLAALFALLGLLACDEDPAPPDGGNPPDAGPVELYPACEDTDPGPLLEPVPSTLIGTIQIAPRLAEAGSVNPALERGELRYREMGLAEVSSGPGLSRVPRTELGAGPAPATGRRSIAWFVHYADFQLADDESPTRLAAADNAAVRGGLRAQEAYLARALSAMNRTLARLERPERPYDFGIITGDCADSAQQNELDWVIAVMNGATDIHTDSGEDDDLVEGPDNDPKDPFDAHAFPAPWLYVPGNHDVHVVGITLPGADLMSEALGTRARRGTRDYRDRWGAITQGDVPADPLRRILTREEIVDRLLADALGEGPVGHGYPAVPDVSLGANYVYEAVPGLLRIVNLDTNDTTGGSDGLVRRATVDDFLVPALEDAEADGVLVMLASHHAIDSIDVFNSEIGTDVVPDAVPPEELEAIVASHPNAIGWLVGHSHDNRIRPVAGPDSDAPGYWEIMAPAIIDFPNQARLIELIDNGDGTLSILATNVDYDEEDCQEQRFRRLSAMEYACAWNPVISQAPEHVNVDMVRAIPASAMTAVSAATGHDRIESDTTLRGE